MKTDRGGEPDDHYSRLEREEMRRVMKRYGTRPVWREWLSAIGLILLVAFIILHIVSSGMSGGPDELYR